VPTPPTSRDGRRTLLQVDGFIEAVFVQPNGRLLIITRHGEQVRLIRAGIGGKLSETVLFSGAPGYRFGAFTQANRHDFLVVNPPHRPQLLLLDIHAAQPQQVTLLETALFRNSAVFATTPHHLFRISGGWILRGTVQNGSYLEEAVGTAHQAQTQLFGCPFSNSVAGFHRVFADHKFFALGTDGTERPLPFVRPPHSRITETAITFTPQQVAVVAQLSGNGRSTTHVQTFNQQGQWQQSWELGDEAWETAVCQFPFLQKPSPPSLEPGDRLHFHPAGWLIQQPQQLKFLPYEA